MVGCRSAPESRECERTQHVMTLRCPARTPLGASSSAMYTTVQNTVTLRHQLARMVRHIVHERLIPKSLTRRTSTAAAAAAARRDLSSCLLG